MINSTCDETVISKSYVKSVIGRVRVPAERFNWEIGIASVESIQQQQDFDEAHDHLFTPKPGRLARRGFGSYIIMIRGPDESCRLQ